MPDLDGPSHADLAYLSGGPGLQNNYSFQFGLKRGRGGQAPRASPLDPQLAGSSVSFIAE